MAGMAVGLGAGWVVFDATQPPCREVLASIDEARDDLSRTAGQGDEGRAAFDHIRTTIIERPDCFPADEVDMWRRTPPDPSNAETVSPTVRETATETATHTETNQ